MTSPITFVGTIKIKKDIMCAHACVCVCVLACVVCTHVCVCLSIWFEGLSSPKDSFAV